MDNVYDVSKRQWKKWNEQEQYVFNHLYEFMTTSPNLFHHPKYDYSWFDDEQWKTTAWNSAWMAADFIRYRRKELNV